MFTLPLHAFDRIIIQKYSVKVKLESGLTSVLKLQRNSKNRTKGTPITKPIEVTRGTVC